MKKMILTLSALVLSGLVSLAAPVERIYIATDRSVQPDSGNWFWLVIN